MMPADLDHRLRIDDCDHCGAIHWRDCVCDPRRPRHVPTADEIERARRARLTRAERDGEDT